jgi:6-phosphogluconolactonase
MFRPSLLSRRGFVSTASRFAASGMAARSLAACAHASPRAERGEGPLLLVGTYTEQGGRDGVHLLRLDPVTGALRPAGTAAAGPNPSFLALHPGRRVVYAVNEVTEWEGRPSGAVSALAIGDDGTLAPLGRRASGGGAPCYVSVDRTGRFALVANYVGGSVAVLPIGADGGLGEATAVVRHEGAGPHPERQRGPHAHCIVPDPSNRWALAADLGIDRILVYRFDDRAGTLLPAAVPFAALAPGAGPRHLAFHPSGRLLYVVNELDLTLGAFGWDADAGALTPLATLPLLERRPSREATAADLHVAPSGRFLYASVRGDDGIVVFSLGAADGRPARVQRVASGGHWPRNFALDPSGRFLLAANQRSHTVVGFHVHPESGALTPTGHRADVPSPVCVRFVT